MTQASTFSGRLAATARPVFGSQALRLLACLGLCAAYLQGGLVKLTDFPARWARWPTSACRRHRCSRSW
jgi:hypothetical protein